MAPLYLVGSVLLSFGTTMGVATLIFQGILGQDGLNYLVPLIVFVLLVALGSDYNIFLMSRVREESASRDLRSGITIASARTGTVITSAGIILAGTFAAMIVAPLQVLQQVGLTVALGVLIDTLIVRSLLIPALTAFIGERAWWPSRPTPHRGRPRPQRCAPVAGAVLTVDRVTGASARVGRAREQDASGFLALDLSARGRRSPRRRARPRPPDAWHEGGLTSPRRRPLLLLDREDAVAGQRGQLVADVGLEHLGAVGVDGEADLVATERVEDPAELVPARDDPRVQVARGADLERDAALTDHGQGALVVGRLHTVTDAVGLELFDDLRRSPRPALTHRCGR